MVVSFDRDRVDPVEDLVAGQTVEHRSRALADGHFVACKIDRGGIRSNRLSLRRVTRRVHADEAATLHVGGLVLDLDATELGGIGGVVEFDRHDVVVAFD